MGLTACPVVGKQKSVDLINAFIAGAPRTADGYVFYGVNHTNMDLWQKVKRKGAPFYYIDNSYFDATRAGMTGYEATRDAQFRVTRNAIQVDAMARSSDGKRFDALGLRIKPMQRNVDGHWVLIEQSQPFMHLVGEPDWFAETLEWAKGTGREVRVRPWSDKKMELQATLPADLEGAWGLLTHSSAAAVTAMLEGITPLVSNMSAVAHVRVSSDNSVDDRRRALQVLADHQFTIQEMKEGYAWAKVGS